MATPEMRPRLTIRPAREADAPALREIFNEAVEDGLATFEVAARTIEEQKRRIANAIEAPRSPLLVAEVRNWVCGSVGIEPFQGAGADDLGELVVFVRRSFRSYGVGQQLMRAAQSEATRLGYRKLIGHVLADNHDSLRLCQVTGWSVVGTYRQHARHQNRLRDVIVVECQVASAAPSES